jgi:hypothetical protein
MLSLIRFLSHIDNMPEQYNTDFDQSKAIFVVCGRTFGRNMASLSFMKGPYGLFVYA